MLCTKQPSIMTSCFRGLVGTAVFAFSIARAGDAVACDRPGPNEHQIDPAEVDVDVTAPEPPKVTASVSRSYGPKSAGCGTAVSSCDGSGTIHFMIEPGVDDRTSSEELGYSIRLVGGKPPAGLELPDMPLIAIGGTDLWVTFPDPGPEDQEAFDGVFQLIAVDAAGNESELSAPVHVQHGGDTGCAVVGPARPDRAWPALFFALALGALARRRLRSR